MCSLIFTALCAYFPNEIIDGESQICWWAVELHRNPGCPVFISYFSVIEMMELQSLSLFGWHQTPVVANVFIYAVFKSCTVFFLAILDLAKLCPLKLNRKYSEFPYPFPLLCNFSVLSAYSNREVHLTTAQLLLVCQCYSICTLYLRLIPGVVQPLDLNRCMFTIIEDSLKFLFCLLWNIH